MLTTTYHYVTITLTTTRCLSPKTHSFGAPLNHLEACLLGSHLRNFDLRSRARIWCTFEGVSHRNSSLFNMAQLFAAISTPISHCSRLPLPLHGPTPTLHPNIFQNLFYSKSLYFYMVDLRVIQTGIYYYLQNLWTTEHSDYRAVTVTLGTFESSSFTCYMNSRHEDTLDGYVISVLSRRPVIECKGTRPAISLPLSV